MKLTHGVNLLVDSQGDCALARSPADAGASAVNELDAIDYKWAFYNAPVGQAIGRYRVVVDCNATFAEMFQLSRDDLIGQSFQSLYPTQVDFEKTG